MTDNEKAFLEMLYHRVLALENLLIVKGWTTVSELEQHNQSIDQYFKEKKAHAKEVPTEDNRRNYQSPIHPPKKPTQKGRRRRV